MHGVDEAAIVKLFWMTAHINPCINIHTLTFTNILCTHTHTYTYCVDLSAFVYWCDSCKTYPRSTVFCFLCCGLYHKLPSIQEYPETQYHHFTHLLQTIYLYLPLTRQIFKIQLRWYQIFKTSTDIFDYLHVLKTQYSSSFAFSKAWIIIIQLYGLHRQYLNHIHSLKLKNEHFKGTICVTI